LLLCCAQIIVNRQHQPHQFAMARAALLANFTRPSCAVRLEADVRSALQMRIACREIGAEIASAAR
jgi:hypothetical protein